MSPSQSSYSHRHSPMGHIRLELSPKNFHAISLDPEPDWTLDDLKAELKDIEAKYSTEVLPENKCPLQSGAIFSCKDLSVVSDFGRNGKPFVMSAFDDDDDDSDEDTDVEDEDGEVSKCSNHSLQLETNLTSDTGAVNEELDREVAANELMSGTGVVEGSLFELERERTLRVQEEIRERMLSFEEDLKAERERSSTALLLVDKERKEKQEMARRVDKQYQRKIAEARDSHLSAVQRDHQQRSQIEERRIRKEAAVEEAKKREKEAREIKEREEKLRAEAEAHAKAAQAAERKAAAEAEKMAAAEAEKMAAAEAQRKAAAEAERKAKEEEARSLQSQRNVPTGVKAKVAESAAKLEGERIGKLNALQEQCQPLRSDPNYSKELKTYERQIGVRLRQVTGTQEQVRVKATELIRLVNDPRLPNSFCPMVFAAKAVSQCETQTLDLNSIVFALAHVIVLVTSQVPVAMDLILAEFHKSCIFTVPKYIPYLKNSFESENAYYKEVGYREDNGKVESTDNYLSRMKAYVALYAAIIQTDIPGILNLHGVREGWAWLARFLNALPPNRFTGAALETFLKIAGFRLYQAYPKPFTKIINLISRDFLVKLKSQNDPDSNRVINNIETYLITQQYRKEPEGHTLAFTDESKSLRA